MTFEKKLKKVLKDNDIEIEFYKGGCGCCGTSAMYITVDGVDVIGPIEDDWDSKEDL